MPWLSFTGMQHGCGKVPGEGIPVVTVGRIEEQTDGHYTMPVAVSVHHGFADGIHISRFLEIFADTLNQ